MGAETGRVLTWSQRVQIALGAAQGLAYLHEGTERSVIFRDLKAGNILLDHVSQQSLFYFFLTAFLPKLL